MPMPRSETFACPSLDGSLDVAVTVGTNCGNCANTRSTDTALLSVNRLPGTETTGLADVKSRRAMREPVTSISSRGSSSASNGDGHSAAATATASAPDPARCAATDMDPFPADAMPRFCLRATRPSIHG